jgi:hypothetical protein
LGWIFILRHPPSLGQIICGATLFLEGLTLLPQSDISCTLSATCGGYRELCEMAAKLVGKMYVFKNLLEKWSKKWEYG